VNAIALTASRIAAAMDGSLAGGDAGREFAGVSIDSRTIRPGDLFVAVKGDRFDGVDFLGAAVANGASGVVVPRGTAVPAAAAAIVVDDTVLALQKLARWVRRESGAKVIAITGSAGKTTTKEMTAELLAATFRVARNRGNFNNHIGLPLSLIELRDRPDVAVVELGMNHAGEIRTLVAIAEPEIRVWTNVGEAHLGYFPSVDAIADAKAEIFDGAGPDTVLVANADDPRIASRTPRFAGRVVTFGIEQPADVRASEVEDRGIDGTAARVDTPAGAAAVTVPLVGPANLLNALAATAVAIQFGISPSTIADRLATLKPAAHRGEVLKLEGGVTLIDDSYNANPTATRRALDVLARAAALRRVAVLGEMLELGDRSLGLHQEVGRAAAGRSDVLFTVGGAPAEAMARAAVAAGMEDRAVRHFATSDEAAAAVADEVMRGDLVLVKGSRGIRTDRVVDRLRAERS
jgi:UDP-N-acetylmuramoyl-tripeptide--D-alanyl-D-alanine ligase